MYNTKIKTNNHARFFSYRNEVPAHILKSDFDYQNPEETIDGFFKYRKRWYHLDQFIRSEHFDQWDAYHSDSCFSGVLIKLSDDGDSFQIGTYYS